MTRNNQKGQIALFITLVVMFIMLMVGLSLSNMAVKQTKITRDAYYSVQAYCLTDTGTEHILRNIKDSGVHPCPDGVGPFPKELILAEDVFNSGDSYNVVLAGCEGDIATIKIFGGFEKTNRAIQISY